jgi:hypothetical protein
MTLIFLVVQHLTGAIVGEHNSTTQEVELLDKITKPFTNLVVQVDKEVSYSNTFQ